MWACGPGDVIPRTGDLLGQERTFKTLASDLLISLPKKKKKSRPSKTALFCSVTQSDTSW